jgi:hypothetical protein
MNQPLRTLLGLTTACLMLAPDWGAAAGTFHFDRSGLSAAQFDSYLATKRDKKKNRSSPISGNSASLLRHGQKYDIDPRLLAAIAGQESSFGLHLCADHNAWNWFWGGSCTRSPFVSYDRAIEVVSKYMRKSYLNKGYTTIPLIQKKYCIDGCQHWINGVNFFFKELQQLESQPLVSPPIPEVVPEPVPVPKPKAKPQPLPASAPAPALVAEPAPAPDHAERNKLWLQGAGMGALLLALLGGTAFMAFRLGRRRPAG